MKLKSASPSGGNVYCNDVECLSTPKTFTVTEQLGLVNSKNNDYIFHNGHITINQVQNSSHSNSKNSNGIIPVNNYSNVSTLVTKPFFDGPLQQPQQSRTHAYAPNIAATINHDNFVYNIENSPIPTVTRRQRKR